jgi:hypothetical protein
VECDSLEDSEEEVSEDEEPSELDSSDDSPLEGESPPPLSSSILEERLRLDEESANGSRAAEDPVKSTFRGILSFHDLFARPAAEVCAWEADVSDTVGPGEDEEGDGEDNGSSGVSVC